MRCAYVRASGDSIASASATSTASLHARRSQATQFIFTSELQHIQHLFLTTCSADKRFDWSNLTLRWVFRALFQKPKEKNDDDLYVSG